MDDKWFKQQQKIAGVTADKIANRMGRSRSAVSHIYTGQRRMSLDWAKAFAETLNVSLDEVLKRAGVLNPEDAQTIAPGFAESDAVVFVGKASEENKARNVADLMGGGKPGIDVWVVKTNVMLLQGFLAGDSILVDTHQGETCRAGDIVIVQVYNRNGGAATFLRRFEPPVLISCSPDPNDQKVYVVDGDHVAILGKVIAKWRAM